MKVISVQSQSGGTGVTLTAAELALTAMAEGKRVLAVDTSPWRCLKEDIEDAGFHYLDDVRQLFRSRSEARWFLDPMPRCGILCYTEAAPHYLSLSEDGKPSIGYSVRAAQEARAECNLAAALASLIRHYDVAIIDVMNKDKRLMQLFYDICDEVHVILRDDMPHCRTVDDWRDYIERPKGKDNPKIIAHSDRKDVRGDLDKCGNSVALKPYLQAIDNRRLSNLKPLEGKVLQ
jgi:cellulose biosynthesis protein BcsQ